MNYFLEIFIDFFQFFWIQNWIWIFPPVATAGYRYRTPAVAPVTAVYLAVTTGKKTLCQTRSVYYATSMDPFFLLAQGSIKL
jgi:hypothetical protein